MINPNDLRELSYILSEQLGTIITDEQLGRLSERQRTFLVVLHNLPKGEKTRDGKNPVSVMKDILGIKEYLDKKETFIKIKFN